MLFSEMKQYSHYQHDKSGEIYLALVIDAKVKINGSWVDAIIYTAVREPGPVCVRERNDFLVKFSPI